MKIEWKYQQEKKWNDIEDFYGFKVTHKQNQSIISRELTILWNNNNNNKRIFLQCLYWRKQFNINRRLNAKQLNVKATAIICICQSIEFDGLFLLVFFSHLTFSVENIPNWPKNRKSRNKFRKWKERTKHQML